MVPFTGLHIPLCLQKLLPEPKRTSIVPAISPSPIQKTVPSFHSSVSPQGINMKTSSPSPKSHGFFQVTIIRGDPGEGDDPCHGMWRDIARYIQWGCNRLGGRRVLGAGVVGNVGGMLSQGVGDVVTRVYRGTVVGRVVGADVDDVAWQLGKQRRWAQQPPTKREEEL